MNVWECAGLFCPGMDEIVKHPVEPCLVVNLLINLDEIHFLFGGFTKKVYFCSSKKYI